MEHIKEIKKERLRTLMHIGAMIAIIIASISLLFAIMTLIKNKEIIQEDPITYVMSEMGFTSCSCIMNRDGVAECVCLDGDGKDWSSVGSNRFYHDRNLGDFLLPPK